MADSMHLAGATVAGAEPAEPLVHAPATAPGSGEIEFSRVRGRTVVTRARSASPLKLLTPRPRGGSAWVFTSTYGGGLVSGDEIALDVRAGQSAVCLLGTQASTKVYRAAGPGEVCRQSLHLSAERGSACVVAPDPVVCFAGAAFVQRQRFDLEAGASLVLLESFTGGRGATGERWAFDRYDTRTDVFVAGQHVFRDAVRLVPGGRADWVGCRVGAFECFASALLIGERVLPAARELLHFVDAQTTPCERGGPGAGLLFAASPVAGDRGALLRVAGPSAEAVARWMRERLSVVPDLLGEDPWLRRP